MEGSPELSLIWVLIISKVVIQLWTICIIIWQAGHCTGGGGCHSVCRETSTSSPALQQVDRRDHGTDWWSEADTLWVKMILLAQNYIFTPINFVSFPCVTSTNSKCWNITPKGELKPNWRLQKNSFTRQQSAQWRLKLEDLYEIFLMITGVGLVSFLLAFI